jgi:hypothetical protein
MLIRLMRREHVVIGGDDGEIGGGTGTQGLLFVPGVLAGLRAHAGRDIGVGLHSPAPSLRRVGATPPASGQSVSSLQLRPSRSTRAIAAAGPQVPAR